VAPSRRDRLKTRWRGIVGPIRDRLIVLINLINLIELTVVTVVIGFRWMAQNRVTNE